MTAPLILARTPDAQAAQWKSVLASGDVAQIAYLARLTAESRSAVDTTFKFTVCDKFWTPMGNIGEELMEATGTDPRNDVPTAKLTLKGKSDIVDMFMECRKTMVGCIVETAGLTFPFYTKSHTLKYEKAETTGNVVLKGIWDILSYYVIWPTWWLPIQFQPFSHAIYMWALCTVLESMVSDCSLRIQTGLNEFVNNALSLNPDIRAWFGRILQLGAGNGINKQSLLSILHTPVYVKRTNPYLDSSPLAGRTVRMETCAAVIKDITRAYGVDTRMDLWRPGDPQPDPWSYLTAPTYVFSTADRSQIEGPTRTIADSVIRTVIDLGGSLGNILAPVIREVPGMDGTFDAPILGVKHQPPWATVIVPDDGEDGSVISAEITDHTPEGWQHIIGGRCVSGETLVHTKTGLLEARSLDGQEVMTLSRGGVYRPAKWKSYGEQQLFRVVFRNGDELFATEGHEWVVAGRDEKITTLDLTGERVPVVAYADRFAQPNYLAPRGCAAEVANIEVTDRIETVYCCEEPVTNTWVAGSGYLTGNSPKWLNDLINATTAWLIDSLMIIVGLSGIPSDLLAGFLNNSFFAFQLIQHYERRAEVGPYHPGVEVFHATASAPYNAETLFAFINALFDSRGYTSALVRLNVNGPNAQYILGRDIFKGGLMSVVYRGRRKMLTDYIEQVMWRITPDVRELVVQVGDGKRDEAPLGKLQRFLSAVFESLNILTLSPQSG